MCTFKALPGLAGSLKKTYRTDVGVTEKAARKFLLVIDVKGSVTHSHVLLFIQ